MKDKEVSFRSRITEALVSGSGLSRYHGKKLVGALLRVTVNSVNRVVPRNFSSLRCRKTASQGFYCFIGFTEHLVPQYIERN